MKITIQCAKDFRLPSYEIGFNSLSQPFEQTDTKWTGLFGNIQFIKTHLQDCNIWLVNYDLEEPVIIQVHIDKPIYQLSFKASSPYLQIEEHVDQATIMLSKTDTIEMSLPNSSGQLLFIHYTSDYFIKLGNASSCELSDFFETNGSSTGFPVSLRANILAILQQIMNVSPAQKLLHFYLQGKAAELLSILWQALKQGSPQPVFTEKEIGIIKMAKEIISIDLSTSYTYFSLSKVLGTNAYSLKKIFKEWFGVSLRQYIHIARMEKARDLLRHSDLAIKKITFVVGYKNVSNFSESFKSYYGYCPSHLRESEDLPGNP